MCTSDLELITYFNELSVSIESYDAIDSFVGRLKGEKIAINKSYLNYKLYEKLSLDNELLQDDLDLEKRKAVKHRNEIEHIKEIYLKDSIAVTKFLFWLEKSIENQQEITITLLKNRSTLYGSKTDWGADQKDLL